MEVPAAAQPVNRVLSTPMLPWAGPEPRLGTQWGGRPAWSSIPTSCLLLVALASAPLAQANAQQCPAQPQSHRKQTVPARAVPRARSWQGQPCGGLSQSTCPYHALSLPYSSQREAQHYPRGLGARPAAASRQLPVGPRYAGLLLDSRAQRPLPCPAVPGPAPALPGPGDPGALRLSPGDRRVLLLALLGVLHP